MIAISVYEKLPENARKDVEQRVLVRIGAAHWSEAPKDGADALTFSDALGGDDDHPALRDELRSWWLERATTNELVARIERADKLSIELAVVLCAEACADLTKDPRVAECRRVRLAWVRGDATDEQRYDAMSAARTAASMAVSDARSAAVRDAALASVRDTVRDAAWDSAWVPWEDNFATPLRTLYPDPCEITVRCGLARWEEAVSEAHNALRRRRYGR